MCFEPNSTSDRHDTRKSAAAPGRLSRVQVPDKFRDNKQYAKVHEILTSHGARMIREMKDTESIPTPESHFEFWALAHAGVLILQVHKNENGVTMFADWPLGTTFEELASAIEKRDAVFAEKREMAGV